VKALLRQILALNDRFAEKAGAVLSWSPWLTVIIIGTAVWIIYDIAKTGHFDPTDPRIAGLVLALTIQTSFDSAATKLFQLALRRSDEKRDEQWMHQLSGMADLTVAIKTELDHSAERDEAARIRDEAAAVRDKAVFALSQRLVSIMENLEEPMDPDKWAALLARIQALPSSKKPK